MTNDHQLDVEAARRQQSAPDRLEDALREVERLRAAIRHHQDQKGDDRCFLDDDALYRVLPESPTDETETSLPPKCEFLKSCERFWEQRQSPLDKAKVADGDAPDSGKTIRQLEDENAALWSLIIQPWTRDGDGAEMYKVNLAWWDSAASRDEAVGMVRGLMDGRKAHKGDSGS